MSDYKHRMTLAVPESMIDAANQLALIAGESADDVNTFTTANWQDKGGNLYAVCSTVVKPIVLSLFGQALDDALLDDDNANKPLAQQALDAAIMYSEGVKAKPENIFIAIDVAPMQFFEGLGLTLKQEVL